MFYRWVFLECPFWVPQQIYSGVESQRMTVISNPCWWRVWQQSNFATNLSLFIARERKEATNFFGKQGKNDKGSKNLVLLQLPCAMFGIHCGHKICVLKCCRWYVAFLLDFPIKTDINAYSLWFMNLTQFRLRGMKSQQLSTIQINFKNYQIIYIG